jgi:glucose-6-phosphate isomerase
MQSQNTNNLTQNNLLESKSYNELLKNFNDLKNIHLRELLSNKQRNSDLRIITDSLYFDFSHEKINSQIFENLLNLAEERNLKEKFENMFRGEKINTTEKRRVLHYALRAHKDTKLVIDGKDVVSEVHTVLENIKKFSEEIRSGKKTGHTGEKLENIVCVGIGGSYLAGEFVYNALRNDSNCETKAKNMQLRFLANVCPIDFTRAMQDLDIKKTLVIIISKTFTTAETMLNARNCRNYILQEYEKILGYKNPEEKKENEAKIISSQFCAVSTNLELTEKFGINSENVFGFWDWVGGRYSVWSAVGALPLSIIFSYENFEKFLEGGRNIDNCVKENLQRENLRKNIPIIFGLLGVWNTLICKKTNRAILPYSQALCKFANHIQQLDMESNGKGVSNVTNEFLNYECGPVVFGEPGTNGQHSFYQLIHQGRDLSCEFIAHAKPQVDSKFPGEVVSSHQELLSNFFAQPDALAYGKNEEEVKNSEKNIPSDLIKHKVFKGDKTSFSLLLKELNPYTVGELLAIYEHRVACEGFIYDINCFDQWGVELGKVLANDVRKVFSDKNQQNEENMNTKFNSATVDLMRYFIKNSDI